MREIAKIWIRINGRSYDIDMKTLAIITYDFSCGCEENGDIEGYEHVGRVERIFFEDNVKEKRA